jgi:hypothetical protein
MGSRYLCRYLLSVSIKSLVKERVDLRDEEDDFGVCLGSRIGKEERVRDGG